jgi:glycosyltransferase involved in cell wall biosynthesis
MKNFKTFFLKIIIFLTYFVSCCIIISCIPFIRSKRKLTIFGTSPILNNKYWSNALNQIGIPSITLVKSYYSSINKKADYDLYFEDLLSPLIKNRTIKEGLYPIFVWLYILKNAKTIVIPFHGIVIKKYFWRLEYFFLWLKNIKVIVLPYGSDAYMYSKIRSRSLQNVLLTDYPIAAKLELDIRNKVFFWSKYADFVTIGLMMNDGLPRWDIAPNQYISINSNTIQSKKKYRLGDGINEEVKILHAPNHRSFKGSEFLVKAIDELKSEGYKVELLLIEKMPNDQVLKLMTEVDILADQFIFTGYALNSIEGMAAGLPVLANLESDNYLKVSRRYSFLDECPILSASPESLTNQLRLLITNPELRKELGQLGVQYVEKYHSYKAAQYMFTNIFKKLDGEDVDLMNLYHPLKSEYVKTNYIKTPLVNNRYVE